MNPDQEGVAPTPLTPDEKEAEAFLADLLKKSGTPSREELIARQPPDTQAYFKWVDAAFPHRGPMPLAKIAWDAACDYKAGAVARLTAENAELRGRVEEQNKVIDSALVERELNLVALGLEEDADVQVPVVLREKLRVFRSLLSEAQRALRPFANYACDVAHVGETPCHNCIAKEVLTRLSAELGGGAR